MIKLDKADKWLIDEIIFKFQKIYSVSDFEARKLMKNSNFMRLLKEYPEQVHHDSASSWAKSIAKQNKLTEKRTLN